MGAVTYTKYCCYIIIESTLENLAAGEITA